LYEGREPYMRKKLALIYLLLLTIGTIFSLYMPKPESASVNAVVIPDEAIRLRILANSDSESDQAVKRLIRDEVNKNITGWVEELTSLDEARAVITEHLPDIQNTAETIITEQGLNQNVTVSFDQADFPTKLYGQYLYPAGEYEAIVITLGDGEGANWWCVLFPPLCFLDFSNGTAVSQTPFEEEPLTEDDANQDKQDVPIDEGETEQEVKQEVKQEMKQEMKQEVKEEVKQEMKQEVKEEVKQEVKQEVVYIEQEEQPVQTKSFFAEIFANFF
jgi:stage II sporulation protein R